MSGRLLHVSAGYAVVDSLRCSATVWTSSASRWLNENDIRGKSRTTCLVLLGYDCGGGGCKFRKT